LSLYAYQDAELLNYHIQCNYNRRRLFTAYAQKPSGANYDEGTPYGYDGSDVSKKKIVVTFAAGGESVKVNFDGQTGTEFGKASATTGG
jgi:hypothetical protein